MLKKFEVRWKETVIIEKKADVYADSEQQAIDIVDSGTDSETINEVVDDYYDWQATRIEEE